MSTFMSPEELDDLGFKSYGDNVKISRNAIFHGCSKMIVGNNVRIDDFCFLSGNIKIGDNVHIAAYCGLWGRYGIEIKDFAGLSSRVSVYSSTDDYTGGSLTNPTIPNKYRTTHMKGEVVLKKHVIVGANSVILPSVTIGEGTAIGAFTLVKDDLDSWSIYAGIPAKFRRNRDRTEILRLEKEFRRENDE